MKGDSMRQQIRSFVLSNFLFTDDPSKLADSASLLGQGVMDSTGVLELISFLERSFGFALHDEEMIPENLDSVDRICAFVERKLAAGGH
jgi:acyl carrier protein